MAAAALLALCAGTLLLGDLLLGLVGFAIILASTAEFWLGVSYRLDQVGASARCGLSVTSMQWEEVRRAVVTPTELLLSPLERSGRLDPFRGVRLRFGDVDRERVMDFVRRRLPSDVRLLEG